MEIILALILLLSPFAGFLINILAGKRNLGASLPGIIASGAVIISFILSLFFFIHVLQTGEEFGFHLFKWIELGEFSISMNFVFDQLSTLWLLVVTGIGALIHIYSIGYMDKNDYIDRYFSFLNLFIFFMIVLVTSGNIVVMFIGWEGVGLCSYLLIGFWFKNHEFNDAAKKAFVMNRVGDLGFLIGIFTLAYLFKTVDYEALKEAVMANPEVSSLLGVATLALFIGATGKSAQIPLYTWLPDAMAGPTPVSALIHAATMVTAGIFMITRLNFIFDLTPDIQTLIAIVIFAIPALLVALSLKIGGGSVLYRQERVTRNGKVFFIYKFRTMIENAEAASGPVLAQDADKRITKLGNFLRTTRLDEVPQLYNILIGDMSIVGPRPERPYFVERFSKEIPEYNLRHKVKAGLTGLAQVQGKYNTSVKDKLKYDLLYINGYSLALDIKLMMQTLTILLKKSSTEGLKDWNNYDELIESLTEKK